MQKSLDFGTESHQIKSYIIFSLL